MHPFGHSSHCTVIGLAHHSNRHDPSQPPHCTTQAGNHHVMKDTITGDARSTGPCAGASGRRRPAPPGTKPCARLGNRARRHSNPRPTDWRPSGHAYHTTKTRFVLSESSPNMDRGGWSFQEVETGHFPLFSGEEAALWRNRSTQTVGGREMTARATLRTTSIPRSQSCQGRTSQFNASDSDSYKGCVVA